MSCHHFVVGGSKYGTTQRANVHQHCTLAAAGLHPCAAAVQFMKQVSAESKVVQQQTASPGLYVDAATMQPSTVMGTTNRRTTISRFFSLLPMRGICRRSDDKQ